MCGLHCVVQIGCLVIAIITAIVGSLLSHLCDMAVWIKTNKHSDDC